MKTGWVYPLFFLSGFPALLYQIVWQRALFTIFGVNIESVTVVVSAFMLGLGLGSLLGGRLSRRADWPLLALFGYFELGIAAFGAVSLPLFGWVAETLAGAGPAKTFVAAFSLVLVPTVLMGATLPMLVAQLVRISGHVGRSVGMLYFVNTLGSATACFAAALVLMRTLGMSGSVGLAAGMNAVIGLSVLAVHFRSAREAVPAAEPEPAGERFAWPGALAVGAATGFISLGYEIVWYRVYSYVTGGSPESFPFVLGAFLAGIAFGSLLSQRFRRIELLILAANAAGFLTAPALAWAVGRVPYPATLPLVALAAGLLGATFPLLCHAAVSREAAGEGLSYLYLSNIAGSALGSYAVGFVLMDLLTLRQIAVALLVLGCGTAALLASRVRVWSAGLAVAGALAAGPLYDSIYERMMYKDEYEPGMRFRDVVETHGGVVTTDEDRHIYGGGSHDGVLTTDLMKADSCIRPFSLGYVHESPREVLLIGMAGGAWAQIVANHPKVERAIVVEIDPGYLQVIARYPEVAPVTRNPKVKVAIDDGRRWMAAHPAQRFDAILMDTMQHWRAHASHLLSVEMLRLMRSRLKPGGVIYYNSTYSDDVMKTGVSVFPYAWRFGPFLALSDSPLRLNEERWRRDLMQYRIGGRPVLDVSDPEGRKRLAEITGYLLATDSTGTEHFATETGESVRERTKGARVITDDNMATEWRGRPELNH